MLTPGQATVLAPGDTISFDIEVFNDGEATAFDVILRDLIDEDFVFITDMNPGWDSDGVFICLLYTSPSPRDQRGSRMPSSA